MKNKLNKVNKIEQMDSELKKNFKSFFWFDFLEAKWDIVEFKIQNDMFSWIWDGTITWNYKINKVEKPEYKDYLIEVEDSDGTLHYPRFIDITDIDWYNFNNVRVDYQLYFKEWFELNWENMVTLSNSDLKAVRDYISNNELEKQLDWVSKLHYVFSSDVLEPLELEWRDYNYSDLELDEFIK